MKKCLFFVAAALMFSTVAFAQTDTIVSKNPSNKNVVLEEYTGINCGYCPDGHKIVNQIVAANPGRVFPINIHTGGYAPIYNTNYGSALANQTGLTGYPAGTVNRHVFSGGHTTLDRGAFLTRSNQILAQTSPVNIAARGTLDYATRELNLTVQLYYTSSSAASTNMLNVAVLQNNILGPQANGAYFNPTQMVNGLYIHQHMLRHLITGQWGETISTTTAGTFVEKTYTYTIPEKFGVTGDYVEAVLQDLVFVVFVAEGHQEILTGTEAVITAVNRSEIDAFVEQMQDDDIATCDNIASVSLLVRNAGTEPIEQLQLQYKVANGDYETYMLNTNIPVNGYEMVELPGFEVQPNVSQTVKSSIIGVNGQDYVSTENTLNIKKSIYTCGGWMMLEIKTDRYGTETSYKIFDPNGMVIKHGGPFTDQVKTYQVDFTPQSVGCYRIVVYDEYGDGINNGYGAGYIKLYDADHNLVFNHDGKFESQVSFNLDVTYPTGIEEHILAEGDVRVFPNPASTVLNFESEESIVGVEMFNMQGQMVKTESGDIRSLSISDLSEGIYMVKIKTSSSERIQKVVKQ